MTFIPPEETRHRRVETRVCSAGQLLVFCGAAIAVLSLLGWIGRELFTCELVSSPLNAPRLSWPPAPPAAFVPAVCRTKEPSPAVLIVVWITFCFVVVEVARVLSRTAQVILAALRRAHHRLQHRWAHRS